jgi:hypothetical protein
MFKFPDPSPYSFDTFLSEKYKAEFDQWVVEKQQAALAAAWKKEQEEKPPYDLDRMVEEARANVADSIQQSKHNYTPLDCEDTEAKAHGFVTAEGWYAYRAMRDSRFYLSSGGSISLAMMPSYAFESMRDGNPNLPESGSGFAGYVRTIGKDGTPVWELKQTPLVRIGCFVLSSEKLPKFLRPLTKEIST